MTSDWSRRRFLTGTAALSLTPLAGCFGGPVELELVAESTFDLTDDVLLPGGDPYAADRENYDDVLITSREKYRERIDPEAWPASVDQSQFDETAFRENGGAEFVVVSEAMLGADGRIEYSNQRVDGDRLLWDISLTCREVPIERLQYRVQRWETISGNPGSIVVAFGDTSCIGEATTTPGNESTSG